MGDKTLIMTFLNEAGNKVNVSVSGVKDDLTQAEVSLCMDTLISKNVLHSTGGDLKTKNTAQITTRTVDILAVI
ncbi:MAG TPA: DUF2922 domain-containing protein [Clostridiaceae bacterium]